VLSALLSASSPAERIAAYDAGIAALLQRGAVAPALEGSPPRTRAERRGVRKVAVFVRHAVTAGKLSRIEAHGFLLQLLTDGCGPTLRAIQESLARSAPPPSG